jgi:hypothetical protein
MVATKVEAAMAAARRAPDGKLVRTAARRPVGRSLGFYACVRQKMTHSVAPRGQWKKKAAKIAADQRAPCERIFRF